MQRYYLNLLYSLVLLILILLVYKFISGEGYTEYPGYDTETNNIGYQPDLENNINKLKEYCNGLNNCMAFSSSGFIKDGIPDRGKWIKKSGTLYVK